MPFVLGFYNTSWTLDGGRAEVDIPFVLVFSSTSWGLDINDVDVNARRPICRLHCFLQRILHSKANTSVRSILFSCDMTFVLVYITHLRRLGDRYMKTDISFLLVFTAIDVKCMKTDMPFELAFTVHPAPKCRKYRRGR